jgi:hypothetical protein
MPRHRKRIPRRHSIAGVIVNPAVCCGRDARQSRALFCKHHPPPLAMSLLTMIAAALTIFRSGLFRAFE